MNLANLFKNESESTPVSAGTTIFEEGDRGTSMYVILQGQVALSIRGTEVDIATPGDFFGEMALIDAQPRSATATAKTDCLLAAIDEERFKYLVASTPYFALYVMRTLVHRLRSMDETIS